MVRPYDVILRNIYFEDANMQCTLHVNMYVGHLLILFKANFITNCKFLRVK